MDEWWSYRLRSFVLFSARTYDRLVETYNVDLWPLQPLLVATAVALLVWLARAPSARRDRVVLAALALAWCTVAWAFEHARFAAINWGADYAALLFVVQGTALAWYALRGGVAFRCVGLRGHLGLALAALGVVAWPLLTTALGQSWARAEVVALMPAPTALATFGCLLLAVPTPLRLLAVPGLAVAFEAALGWGLYARVA